MIAAGAFRHELVRRPKGRRITFRRLQLYLGDAIAIAIASRRLCPLLLFPQFHSFREQLFRKLNASLRQSGLAEPTIDKVAHRRHIYMTRNSLVRELQRRAIQPSKENQEVSAP